MDHADHPQFDCTGFSVAIISRDEEFIDRVRVLGCDRQDGKPAVAIFSEWLPALVELLRHSARVILYDLDFDTMAHNLEMLRAVRLICRHGAIILGASAHSTAPFESENDVGIYYRILKSAPDSELLTALRSAELAAVRKL
jgi:hypothetical protein